MALEIIQTFLEWGFTLSMVLAVLVMVYAWARGWTDLFGQVRAEKARGKRRGS